MPMNFFERQAQARRLTRRLVLLFALAVLGTVALVDAGVWLLLGGNGESVTSAWPLLAVSSLLALAVIGVAALYRIASLRGGGDAVAASLGGQWVAENTASPSLRRLRNVVEEIAIASGVPVPRLYVLEHEPRINAFAAGYAPADAVIGVTRGALEQLDRDELQGVIAHEFSHILNGDMRLNLRLMGPLFGIQAVALIGQKLLDFNLALRRDDEDDSGRLRLRADLRARVGMLGLGVLLLIAGYVGLFFARLIKAAVSRRREELADASAVQFTRNPGGLAGALKKIAAAPGGARLLVGRADAEEVSHLLFGDGVGLQGWFATHPPLQARIHALDPSYDPTDAERDRARRLRTPAVSAESLSLHLPKPPPALPDIAASFALAPPQVVQQVAAPEADDYRQADLLLLRMPDALRDLAGQRQDCMPVILALLLHDDDAVAETQLQQIRAVMGDDAMQRTRGIHQQLVADLHPMLRLPLAQMAFPALRQHPRPPLDAFVALVDRLAQADAQTTLFDYCLGQLVHVQVREALAPGRHPRFGRARLGEVREPALRLLAYMAHVGHADGEAARRAFVAGAERLYPGDVVRAPALALQPTALDDVWPALDQLQPAGKELVVEALTLAVTHDGRIRVAEAELLRAVCGLLHCPLPAFLLHAGARA